MRPEVLAEAVGQAIAGAVRPVALRVAELEGAGRTSAITFDALTTSLGDLGARVAALEARAPVPGPPGPEGPPGPAGADGKDGQGLNYTGTFVGGKSYDVGDLVTDHGSLFYCARSTTTRPASSPDWKLMVKRGQDGKDLR